MKTKTILLTMAAVAVLAGSGYAVFMMGMKQGAGSGAETTDASAPVDLNSIAAGEEATRRHIKDGIKAGDVDPKTGQKIIYYHDPMVPGKRFDAPAKSPFMDMMLVPVYTGAGAQDGSNVTVSPRVQQNLGLRTAEVVQGTLNPQLQAVGSIAWNERDQSVVQARAAGFIEPLLTRCALVSRSPICTCPNGLPHSRSSWRSGVRQVPTTGWWQQRASACCSPAWTRHRSRGSNPQACRRHASP